MAQIVNVLQNQIHISACGQTQPRKWTELIGFEFFRHQPGHQINSLNMCCSHQQLPSVPSVHFSSTSSSLHLHHQPAAVDNIYQMDTDEYDYLPWRSHGLWSTSLLDWQASFKHSISLFKSQLLKRTFFFFLNHSHTHFNVL